MLAHEPFLSGSWVSTLVWDPTLSFGVLLWPPAWHSEVSPRSLQPSYLPPRSILIIYFSLCMPLGVQELSDVDPALNWSLQVSTSRTSWKPSSALVRLPRGQATEALDPPGLRYLNFPGSESSYFPNWVFLTPGKCLWFHPTLNNLDVTWI